MRVCVCIQGVSGPSSSCVWNPRVFADANPWQGVAWRTLLWLKLEPFCLLLGLKISSFVYLVVCVFPFCVLSICLFLQWGVDGYGDELNPSHRPKLPGDSNLQQAACLYHNDLQGTLFKSGFMHSRWGRRLVTAHSHPLTCTLSPRTDCSPPGARH